MAEREALTAAEADRILKPANRCRVGHQHAPDRFAEDAELVRCRCGAVRKAHEQHKRLRIWDSSWWLGCPPTVDTASTDEPLFEEPADDDETTFGVVPEWGPVPELAPVRQGPHQHAKAKHVDEGDHWRLVCACGATATLSKVERSHQSAWSPGAGAVQENPQGGATPALPQTADGRTAAEQAALELEGSAEGDAAWKRERAQATADAVNATRAVRLAPAAETKH